MVGLKLNINNILTSFMFMFYLPRFVWSCFEIYNLTKFYVLPTKVGLKLSINNILTSFIFYVLPTKVGLKLLWNIQLFKKFYVLSTYVLVLVQYKRVMQQVLRYQRALVELT